YVLQDQSSKGHVGFPEAAVLEQTLEKTGISREIVEAAVEAERAAGDLVREPGGDEPWLYLKPLFLVELGVARSLTGLCAGVHPLGPVDTSAAIAWVQNRMALELAPAQRDAIARAMREKVLIITGGPGVGKTTIVRGIIEVFAAKGLDCGLCAPTGRAAK